MRARTAEDAIAPPSPCVKRAAISIGWLPANPHTADAAVKRARPSRKTFLRPARSPRRPAISRKLAKAIMYAFTTHVRSAWEKCRSRWMDGSATFTIVASTTIISCPRQTTASATQRRREALSASWIVTISWTISMPMRIHKRAIIRTDMSTSGELGSMVLLTRLSRLVYKAASEDALGMKLKAYVTLTTLRNGPMPQQELCISMHLDPNNCVLLLNEMEAAGHVRRSRDPADRRRHIVEITDAGRRAVARSDEALNEVEGQVLGNLSKEERASLRSLLNRAMADEPVPA